MARPNSGFAALSSADEQRRGAAGDERKAMSRQPKIKLPVAKRSLVIGTRKTSITLEADFWEALKSWANLRPASDRLP
jgi:hypothetical protein